MARSGDYKGLIRQSSIILFVVLALYLALVRPLARQGVNMLQSQIDETVAQLQRYLALSAESVLPTEENAAAMETYLAREKESYRDLKNFIDPPRAYLPEGTQEAGLYFIEQLHITTKRLRRQANTLKIEVPESFGFSEEMPEDTQNVELLLSELDIVERVTTLLMEDGVEEISLVKPLGRIEKRDRETEKLFYREPSIQFSFLCSSPTLIKFLYQIKNFSPILIVKDIIVERTEGTSLQVEMLLSRLLIS